MAASKKDIPTKFSILAFLCGLFISWIVFKILEASGITNPYVFLAAWATYALVCIIGLSYMLASRDPSQASNGKSFMIGTLGLIFGLIAERTINTFRKTDRAWMGIILSWFITMVIFIVIVLLV